MVRLRLFRRGHLSLDELSAYLDGRGSDRGHLASCEVCRSELASLEGARGYLSALSEVQVPRSFMAGVTLSPALSHQGRGIRWLPAMRMATAGVAGLLVLAVGVESYGATGMAPGAATMTRDMAYEAAPAPVQEKAADEVPRAPAGVPAQQQGASRSALAAAATATATAVVPTAVVVRDEERIGLRPGPVSSGLGMVLLLIGSATIGFWIAERRS